MQVMTHHVNLHGVGLAGTITFESLNQEVLTAVPVQTIAHAPDAVSLAA